jgi:hypothetical protein
MLWKIKSKHCLFQISIKKKKKKNKKKKKKNKARFNYLEIVQILI